MAEAQNGADFFLRPLQIRSETEIVAEYVIMDADTAHVGKISNLELAQAAVEAINELARLRALLEQREAVNAELITAFHNVDELDWQHLLMFIPESGHGRFWKEVFAEVRAALDRATGAAA